MLSGFTIISLAVINLIFKRKSINGQAILALLVILIGLCAVVYGSMDKSKHNSKKTYWYGGIIISSGYFLHVLSVISEESLVEKYGPLVLSGYESLFGLIFMIILMIPLCLIPCESCEYGHVEDVWIAMK